MLIESIGNSGSLPVLEKLAAFTEARHKVLLTNVANLGTPGYRPRDVDLDGFQRAMAEAIDRREHVNAQVDIRSGDTWRVNARGAMEVGSAEVGPQNVLFHDGTNASVEQQMNELAKNALLHQTAIELMRQRFGLIKRAIQGRAG